MRENIANGLLIFDETDDPHGAFASPPSRGQALDRLEDQPRRFFVFQNVSVQAASLNQQ